MPRRHGGASRPTLDLHAPWWSEARDESGRYLERAVVYAAQLYRDQRAGQERLMASGLLGKVGLDKLAGMDEGKLRAGDPAALSATLAELGQGGVDLSALARASEDDLLDWLVEITDEGGTPVLARDESGVLPPDARAVLEELDARDVQFLLAEVQKRQAAPVAPVLPEDERMAARGHPAAADGKGAAGVAEERFRGGGGDALS